MRHIPYSDLFNPSLISLLAGRVAGLWRRPELVPELVPEPAATLALLEAELQALEMFRADLAEIELRGQELEETHARLDAALHTMPHGLLMLDADLRVVLCNRRLRALFGFDPDIVRVGATLAQVVAPGTSAPVLVERVE